MSLRKMREWRDCRDPRLSAGARQVLNALLTYADADGLEARPSVGRLAADCGRGVRWVQEALAVLRGLGAIVVARKATRYTPTVYTILSPSGVHAHAPLSLESPRVMGAQGRVSGVHGCAPDQVLRSGKEQTAAPRPALDSIGHGRQRPESPTVAQVTKLVYVILDDPEQPLDDRSHLIELVKRACARAGFIYDTRVVTTGIQRALAGRGLDPDSLNIDAARRRHA